ncbi:MAG: hypothetical protein Q9204_002066 [Flavoplaca sp. TL-2023a]
MAFQNPVSQLTVQTPASGVTIPSPTLRQTVNLGNETIPPTPKQTHQLQTASSEVAPMPSTRLIKSNSVLQSPSPHSISTLGTKRPSSPSTPVSYQANTTTWGYQTSLPPSGSPAPQHHTSPVHTTSYHYPDPEEVHPPALFKSLKKAKVVHEDSLAKALKHDEDWITPFNDNQSYTGHTISLLIQSVKLQCYQIIIPPDFALHKCLISRGTREIGAMIYHEDIKHWTSLFVIIHIDTWSVSHMDSIDSLRQKTLATVKEKFSRVFSAWASDVGFDDPRLVWTAEIEILQKDSCSCGPLAFAFMQQSLYGEVAPLPPPSQLRRTQLSQVKDKFYSQLPDPSPSQSQSSKIPTVLSHFLPPSSNSIPTSLPQSPSTKRAPVKTSKGLGLLPKSKAWSSSERERLIDLCGAKRGIFPAYSLARKHQASFPDRTIDSIVGKLRKEWGK